MKKSCTIYSSLALLFIQSLLFSQRSNTFLRHYGVENGLPSSEVYDVIQDSKGFMWFATDKGVCRYDGDEFTTFTREHNLPDNTVFKLFEDYRKRIWFVTFSLQLAWYENGKINIYPHNQKIREAAGNSTLYTSFYVDSLDNVYLGIYGKGLVKIDGKGRMAKVDDRRCLFKIHQVSHRDVLVSIPNYCTTILFPNGDSLSSIITSRIVHVTKAILRQNGDILLIFNNFYLFKKGWKSMDEISSDILCLSLYEDKDNNIWVGKRKKGMFLYEKADLSSEPRVFLDGFSVSSVFQDREGGYWFTTHEDGIYYTPSKHFHLLQTNDPAGNEKVTSIAQIDSHSIIAGFSNGNLYKGHDKDFTRVKHPLFSDKESIFKLYYDGEQETLIMCSSLYPGDCFSVQDSILKDKKKNFKNNDGVLFATNKQIIKSRDKTYWLAGANQTIAVNDDSTIFDTRKTVNDHFRVNTLFEDHHGKILAGNLEGLWILDKKKGVYKYDPNIPELNQRITFITSLPDSTLCLATKDAGLILLKKKKVVRLTRNNGLCSNNISHCFADSNTLWLSTEHGINSLHFTNLKKYTFTLKHYSVSNGLPSNEVTEIIRAGKLIYAATKKGLAVFNPDHITPNTQPPPIYIHSVRFNGRDTTTTENLLLKHDQNAISIRFSGLTFRNPGKTLYRYRLLKDEAADTAWNLTTANQIQLTGLAPGNYSFLVSAMNDDAVWSTQPAQMNFSIAAPFWATAWFRTSLTAAFAGAGILLVRRRLRRIGEKNTIEKRMIELEAKALHAQMNPHFIFNSLNSIQSFIATNRTEEAEIYLADFSRLIRLILENSRNQEVKLAREMELLNYYLMLEKMRFPEKFDYILKAEPDIDTDHIFIPPMLVQPYIENAILHGVGSLRKGGKISVSFSRKDKHILCIVEDNGIGREEAQRKKALQRVKHTSFGTRITEERLMLQEKLSGHQKDAEKFNVFIKDLKDEHSKVLGTRVELLIPFSYKIS